MEATREEDGKGGGWGKSVGVGGRRMIEKKGGGGRVRGRRVERGKRGGKA